MQVRFLLLSNSWFQGQILISLDQGAMETRPSMFSKWLYNKKKARICKVQKAYTLHIVCHPNLFSLTPGGCREGSLGAQEIKRKKSVCAGVPVCMCKCLRRSVSTQIYSPGKEMVGRDHREVSFSCTKLVAPTGACQRANARFSGGWHQHFPPRTYGKWQDTT